MVLSVSQKLLKGQLKGQYLVLKMYGHIRDLGKNSLCQGFRTMEEKFRMARDVLQTTLVNPQWLESHGNKANDNTGELGRDRVRRYIEQCETNMHVCQMYAGDMNWPLFTYRDWLSHYVRKYVLIQEVMNIDNIFIIPLTEFYYL